MSKQPPTGVTITTDGKPSEIARFTRVSRCRFLVVLLDDTDEEYDEETEGGTKDKTERENHQF